MLIVMIDGAKKTLRPAFSSENFNRECRYRHWNVMEDGKPVLDVALPINLAVGMKFRSSGHDFEIVRIPSHQWSHHPAITIR